MNDTRLLRSALRWTAIAVAIAAIVDPAFTSSRYGKLVVAVIATDLRDPDIVERAGRVGKALASSATVIDAPFAAADATVIVGDRLPDAALASATPVFAVVQGRDEPHIVIESMDLPRSAMLDATVPASAGVRFTGAAGRTVEVTYAAGDVVVDRITRQVRSADERIDVALSAVAGDTGVLPLRVEARVAGGAAVGARADAAVDVRALRHAVLFYDARPSFASTFVRRAVERDPRFAVTARSMTSRAVSVDAGVPPARLDDAGSLAPYDAVVVGAPGDLGEAAVAGLDAYLRNRGGSVVFLLDERRAAPFERLTGTRDWRAVVGQSVAVKTVGGIPALLATSVAWPAVLPAGASAVASAVAFGDSSRPVVWRSPVGAGQVVVSGALDAWRFRDAASSAFERFWRDQIADAAARAPAPVSVSAPSVAAPNERLMLGVDLRDAALRVRAGTGTQSVRATVAATLTPLGGRRGVDGMPTDLRLWPSGSVGHFEASFRAPSAPGTYRIDVESGAERASVPIVVSPDAASPVPAARAILEAWVTGHGGSVIGANDLGALPAAIRAVTSATPRAERWHPMSSAWWLVVFALALSAEWWLRRRQGLA